MNFVCRAIDETFFETAPTVLRHVGEIPASAAETFSVLEDGASWPVWFKGIREVTWLTPKPFGVGTRRTVRLDTVTVEEFFFRWDVGKRLSFYLTRHDRPLTHALAEDYNLVSTGPASCRFEYAVAFEPRMIVKLTRPLTVAYFNHMFAGAVKGLGEYMRSSNRPADTLRAQQAP